MADNTFAQKVHHNQEGDTITVASGGLIDIETGGDIKYNGDSLIDEIAALSGLDSGELGVLNGVTPGTAAASKALVLGASSEIATITSATITTLTAPTVNATNIDAGASGTAGSVDVFPATAANGKLSITCAAQGAGNATSVLTLDAMAQATTVHIPNPGAVANSYIAQSSAALSLAEVDVLDNVTPGTAAASKALVLNASSAIATIADATITHLTTTSLTFNSTLLTCSGAELNTLTGAVANATITVAPETSPTDPTRAIAIQLKDAAGADIASVQMVQIAVFANGSGTTWATGGSTGISIGTDGALLPIVAKLLFAATCEADGDIDLVWTDSGTEAVYLGVILPNGKIVYSTIIQNS